MKKEILLIFLRDLIQKVEDQKLLESNVSQSLSMSELISTQNGDGGMFRTNSVIEIKLELEKDEIA